MIWLRGSLEVGTSGRLENSWQGPMDFGLSARRCCVEYRGLDDTVADGPQWRFIRMVGRPVGAGHWLLRRGADESELELTLSEDRCMLLGRFSRPGVQQNWRIVLEQTLPLLSPGLVAKPLRARYKPPHRGSLVASHYSLVAGQWRNGETRQRDALLLAGKVWQHARMGLRRTESFAADVLVGLATGLPGHAAAPAASRIVLDALRRLLIERPELRTAGRPGHRLMVEVQRELHRRLGRRPHGRGAGASVVLAHLRGAELLVLAIGTCRAVWLGADGASSVLGLAQDHMALRRPRTEFVPSHGYPVSFRHPTQALSADGDSDLLAVQLVRRTLAPGDTVLLLSPGAVDALAGAQGCDDVELVDALRRHLLGARTTLARAKRIRRALQPQVSTNVGSSSFLLLCYPGRPP
jgi:serine/threonine protein phosphatase PrpC